ncbi:putative MFS family arabinose efflux permease [Herbaspirillum sp. Sphag1AN]|uniref:hypothetical protein n=1 Tax=unclassified Herbaspirillum TaxID=2624150 RepID=UPI001797DF8C|nr:putative MFS family arabinose efflux permease [Herbaspirillum sp. Sphag1AN]MBB3247104.1 putative MFS family arabinose efflux permease [Herbaspirillum sp. Sphag64]
MLKSPFFLANVALSVLVFTAMFAGYTYLAEMLEKAAGIAPAQGGWWLMGFGAVGLVGNWLGGLWVDQKPLATTAFFCVLLALGMAISSWGPGHVGYLSAAIALLAVVAALLIAKLSPAN